MKRRTSLALVGIALCAAAAAPVAQAQAPSPARLAGCWDVRLGEWRWGRVHPDADTTRAPELFESRYYTPPARIRLDTLPNAGPIARAAFAMHAAPGALPSVHRYTFWGVDGDTIVLTWSTGFTGLSARLAERGDSLVGRAETFTDAAPSATRVARLTALRVRCDAPLAPADSARYRYPRGVLLATGDSIRLHEELPAHVPVRARARGGLMVDAELAGEFAAADSLFVRFGPDGEQVWRIVFVLRAADRDEWVRRLSGLWGPPGFEFGGSAYWRHPMSSVVLLERPGFLEVRIYDPRA